MNYESLNEDLIAAFPELERAYKEMRGEWGDEKPGQYILFEDIFARYVDYFLAADASPARDGKLREVFSFIETLFASGGEVENLAFVAMLEGRPWTWLQASKPFLGPRAEQALDQYNAGWREESLKNPKRHQVEIHDCYGLRKLAERVLQPIGSQ